MNQQAYRLVFNAHRGALMAVAENVSSRSKSQAATHQPKQVVRSNMRLAQLGVFIACLFGAVTLTINTAQAQISAAANVSQRPVIDQSANGLPIVQIVTPNGAGVSHNRYDQFNVGQQGAILNNAQSITSTQQAGYIAGNPALAGGSARLILNEVTSANPSYLRGYLEVAGQRADVIIANPNGISCSGCGFINTSRGVLSTGTPEFAADGQLANLRVTQGHIAIGSMNAAPLDQVDLIARSVQVNGELWGNALNVISGANLVNYANLGVQVIAGQGPQPTVAIDLAQLGGMYANTIRLIGTEAGIGVVSNGEMAAAGQFHLDVAGKITLAGHTTATGKITIVGDDDIDNRGQLYAGQALQLSSSGKLDNSGLIAAQADIKLQAHDIANHNTIAAGVDATGNTSGSGTLQLNADNNIDNRNGNLYGKDDLLLRSGTTLNNSNGQIHSDGNLTANAGTTLDNRNGQIHSNGAHASLTLGAADIDNSDGDIINLGSGTSTLTAINRFTNTATLSSTGDLRVTAGQLDNSGLINSSANTTIRADALRNFGRIYGDDVALGAGTLLNDVNPASNDAGVIAARHTLHIGASDIINREHALLQSLGDMHIGGSLDSDDQASGSAGSILNASATIDAGGDLSLHTTELINRNDHFSTSEEIDPSQTRHVTEYADWTQPDVWYRADEVRWSNSGGGGIVLVIPDGNRYEKFYKRDYTEIVINTVVQSSDPGSISASGNMLLSGQITNDKSRIIAGGSLSGTLDQLTNIGAVGTTTTIRQMSAGQNYYHWVSGESHTNYYQYDHGGAAYDNIMARIDTELNIGSGSPHGEPEHIDAPHSPLPRPSLNIPNNGLFILHPQPGLAYLVETDPRFTNYQTFLSSDYLLSRLGLDPQQLQKRLGDGYYEQKIITDQLIELTGKRLLGGYASAEDQFRALMEAGVASAEQFQLTPGIALCAAQIAALTADIVWLVEQDVTLPDGSQTKVLAPVVYLSRLSAQDIAPNGTLIAAQDIQLKLNGSLDNSGTLLADKQLIVQATDLHNSGSIRSSSDGDVLLAADHDLVSHGNISGGRVGILAGNDITLASTTASHTGANGLNSRLDQISSIDAAQVSIQAGRDVNLIAAAIHTNGDAAIAAGRDLNLATVTTQQTDNITYNKNNHLYQSSTQVIGAAIDSGGALTLSAGQDIHAQAAYANAEGALTAVAGRDVNLGVAQQESSLDQAIYTTSNSFLSSSNSRSQRDDSSTANIGTTLSGDSVTVLAGHDLNITGSNVVASRDLTLAAANDITITTSQDRSESRFESQEQRSGLMTSGASMTIGNRDQDSIQVSKTLSNNASTIGSTAGNVNILAGKTYTQTGSDVLALTGDLSIAAQQVNINAATDTSDSSQDTHFQQSGLTLQVTNPVLSAIQGIQQLQKASSKTTDKRMQGLAAGAAALTVANTAVQVADSAAPAGGIDLAISIGASSSQSHSEQHSASAVGSTVAAGGNVSIRASGAAQDSNLTIQGSDINAGNNIALQADNQINLLAAQNNYEQHSSNSGSSASIGVSIGSSGFMVTASASGSRGTGDGSDLSYSNSHVTAGNGLTITSGSDTTLQGASVSGQQVNADIGGNLHIESLQDSSHYASRQQSLGGSISVGVGKISGSINAARSKVDGDYLSVQEQSGIKAGDGGFQVKVQGNTELIGGQIASTEQALQDDKNSFASASLITRDIENHSDYHAESQSFSAGGGNSGGKSSLNGTGIGFGNASGHDDSVTTAGISGMAGDTAIRSDQDNSGKLVQNWDGQQLQQDVEAQTKITEAFGKQAALGIGTYATAKLNDLNKQIADEPDPEKKAQLQNEAEHWQEGGAYRTALHAAAGALTGGLAGAAGATTSALAMPIIAEQIDKMDLPNGVKQGLTQVAAGALGVAVGGTAGVAASVNTEANNRQLHQSERDFAKENAKKFAQYYKDQTGQTIDEARAEQMLLGDGYRMVDAAANKGPGVAGPAGDAVAASFLAQNAGNFLKHRLLSSIEPSIPIVITQ